MRHIRIFVIVALLAATVACGPSVGAPVDTSSTTSTSTSTTSTSTTTTTTTTTTSTSTTVPAITPAPGGTGWRLAFSDEFNGTSLDASKWTPCFSWAWDLNGCTVSFNEGREAYSPQQVTVADGRARLTAQPGAAAWGKDYRSGLLSTTNRPMSTGNPASLYKFRYGYIEGRMKLPGERGMFSAFWLLPPDYNRWNYAYEIDIFETLGGGDPPIWMHVHHTNRTRSWSLNGGDGRPGACPWVNYSDGFHTYGVDWQPGYIDYYLDGVRCGRFTGPIWSGDMEIIVNLMVDVTWQQAYGLTTRGPTTGHLDIDYIRVWQR